MEERIQSITDLFLETGQAHHQAYIETDGYDQEWPVWYADYLLDRLTKLLEVSITKSELVNLLVHLSEIQPAEASGASWADFYAQYLVQHYLN